MTKENFIDKTTQLKTVERISLEAIPFAKGYKIKLKVAFNPEDSMHLDQLINDDPEKSEILVAVEGFKRIITNNLGGHIIKDD